MDQLIRGLIGFAMKTVKKFYKRQFDERLLHYGNVGRQAF